MSTEIPKDEKEIRTSEAERDTRADRADPIASSGHDSRWTRPTEDEEG